MGGIAKDIRQQQLLADVQACGQSAMALYQSMLTKGESAEFAAMCACRQPPGTRFTDKAFCQGQRKKMEGMSKLVGGMLHDSARKAGIDTRGKYYVGQLGKATEPSAWVTCAEDVLTVCKAKNYEMDGVIKHKAIVKDPIAKKSTGLAHDIVNKLAKRRLACDPSLAEKCRKSTSARQELREQIIDKHARKPTRKASRLG